MQDTERIRFRRRRVDWRSQIGLGKEPLIGGPRRLRVGSCLDDDVAGLGTLGTRLALLVFDIARRASIAPRLLGGVVAARRPAQF